MPADDVSREDGLLVPVGDETVAASRFHAGDPPRPTLLTYVPYHKDVFSTYGGYETLYEYLATSGYDVVVADLVGTGASSGFKAEPDTAVEGEEAAAIVEWLAGRPWSTGRVGMFGLSYGATTALRAAAENPEALGAIVPIHGPARQFREAHEGGSFAFYRMGGDWLPLMTTLAALPPARRDPEGRWSAVWGSRLDALEDHTPWLFQYLDHRTKDDYWAGKDVPAADIGVPTLAVGGWRDPYVGDTIEYFEAIDAPKRLLLGPWRHAFPHEGRESAIDFRARMVAWFDRFLADGDEAVLEWPRISYWTERDGGGKVDGGAWRATDRWPTLADGGGRSFALSPDGLVAEDDLEAQLERRHEPDYTVGVDSMDDVYFSNRPVDTNADDARSLTFEAGPLAEAVELTGTGAVDLRLSSETPDPFVVARVVDVAPDGAARLVTHGELQAAHRGGFGDPEPLAPGETYPIRLPLKPKSHVFEAGHRIRLAVSAAYFPLNFPPREAGALTVRSAPEAPSALRFPGQVHGSVAFEDAIEMGDPVGFPTESGRVSGAGDGWTVAREHLRDAVSVRTTGEERIDLPFADCHSAEHVEARVDAADPSTASIESVHEIELEYGHETVAVEGRSRVSRDGASLSVRAEVDGRAVFEERWRR